MADPVETVTKAPQKAAKGLSGVFKGKPAWVWVAGVTALLGAAYLAFSRRNVEDPNEPAANDGTGAGDDMALGDYGGYYPVASEGAYGGYDQPQDLTPVVSDNAGGTEPSPITVNVTYPAPVGGVPTGGGKAATTGTPTHAPVAGGVKKWHGHPLAWWQSPKHGRKRVKVNGKWVYRWRWPSHPGTYNHTRAFAGG